MITAMPRIAIAVEDFSAVISMFGETLGMPVLDFSARSVDDLGARLGICFPEGGSNIEIMSPGDPETPLSQSVQGFISRRGEGHFALMLEAADPDTEAEILSQRGLNVLPRMEGAGGRDVHPGSTHGVLIRVYPIDSIADYVPAGQMEATRPSALSGIQRVVIAVKDVVQACETYGKKFAMEVSVPVVDSLLGIRSAVCTPPAGGVIELVQVEDASKPFAGAIERFLTAKGEGMYALVLQSGDLEGTRALLESRGVPIGAVHGLDSILELDSAAMFGARIWIEPSRQGY